MSIMTLSPYPSLFIARKRAVFALRAEFSSLSFPKEKESKKKGNLRACALKNPPNCTDLLCSIKNDMLVVVEITGRASSPFGQEIVRSGKKKKVGETIDRTCGGCYRVVLT